MIELRESMPTLVHSRRRPGGVTLMETMIAIIVSSILFVIFWRLMSSGMRRSAETADEVEAMSGVRSVIENLTKDINAGHTFLAEGANKLGLVRYAKRIDIAARLSANDAAKTYPVTDEEDGFEHKLSGIKVLYTFDPDARTITREEEPGNLVIRHRKFNEVESVQFQGSGNKKERQLTDQVSAFELFYTRYDDSFKLTKSESDEIEKSACVGVTIKAEPELKREGHRKIEVHIATKIWMMTRLYDGLYPQYFSSVDADQSF